MRNGKSRDSSSEGGWSLIPVMSCAVMSVLGPGVLPLVALPHVWLYPEEGAEILHCTFQGLGYEIWVFINTLNCT